MRSCAGSSQRGFVEVVDRCQTPAEPEDELRDESLVPDLDRQVHDRPILAHGRPGTGPVRVELAELVRHARGNRQSWVDEAELVHRTTLSLALGVSEMHGRIAPLRRDDQGRVAQRDGPHDATMLMP